MNERKNELIKEKLKLMNENWNIETNEWKIIEIEKNWNYCTKILMNEIRNELIKEKLKLTKENWNKWMNENWNERMKIEMKEWKFEGGINICYGFICNRSNLNEK